MNEYLIFMCSRSLIKNKIYAGWYALILMLREYMRPWVCCFFRVLNFKNNSSILLSINRNGYTHVSIILVLLNISSILPAICPCGLALARYFSQIDEKRICHRRSRDKMFISTYYYWSVQEFSSICLLAYLTFSDFLVIENYEWFHHLKYIIKIQTIKAPTFLGLCWLELKQTISRGFFWREKCYFQNYEYM